MITKSNFQPAWWLPGPHAQTLFASLVNRPYKPTLRRQRLALPDGDFIDLDWAATRDGPLILVLHGLEGSSQSGYANGLLFQLEQHGYQGILMHFRGCSGTPNRLARGYHSGETGDLEYLLETLQTNHPGRPIAVVGFSLGGNVLLKWLGEKRSDTAVTTAVAVSVPFDLHKAAARLERGFSRVYQFKLLMRLRQTVRAKFSRGQSPVDLAELSKLTTFRAFDDQVTAPLHGFTGVDDYYDQSSSRAYLAGIGTPTLILHARDDPFLTEDGIPEENELSSQVTLELSDSGGHTGFISGNLPWRPYFWLEHRICRHLDDITGL